MADTWGRITVFKRKELSVGWNGWGELYRQRRASDHKAQQNNIDYLPGPKRLVWEGSLLEACICGRHCLNYAGWHTSYIYKFPFDSIHSTNIYLTPNMCLAKTHHRQLVVCSDFYSWKLHVRWGIHSMQSNFISPYLYTIMC